MKPEGQTVTCRYKFWNKCLQMTDTVWYNLKGLAEARSANTYADDGAGAEMVLQERKHMEEITTWR